MCVKAFIKSYKILYSNAQFDKVIKAMGPKVVGQQRNFNFEKQLWDF
jgi:hypothetical protein